MGKHRTEEVSAQQFDELIGRIGGVRQGSNQDLFDKQTAGYTETFLQNTRLDSDYRVVKKCSRCGGAFTLDCFYPHYDDPEDKRQHICIHCKPW